MAMAVEAIATFALKSIPNSNTVRITVVFQLFKSFLIFILSYLFLLL